MWLYWSWEPQNTNSMCSPGSGYNETDTDTYLAFALQGIYCTASTVAEYCTCYLHSSANLCTGVKIFCIGDRITGPAKPEKVDNIAQYCTILHPYYTMLTILHEHSGSSRAVKEQRQSRVDSSAKQPEMDSQQSSFSLCPPYLFHWTHLNQDC